MFRNGKVIPFYGEVILGKVKNLTIGFGLFFLKK